jgi:hypothetical protein
MSAQNKYDLFEFMLERVRDIQKKHLDSEPQAFGRWFGELFYTAPRDIYISDGSKDGTIDLFFSTDNGKNVLHHVLTSKDFSFRRFSPMSRR